VGSLIAAFKSVRDTLTERVGFRLGVFGLAEARTKMIFAFGQEHSDFHEIFAAGGT